MTVEAPWTVPLSTAEHSLIYYFLTLTGLALLAYLLWSWASRGEIGPRYRAASHASICVAAVALISYVVLVVGFHVGYRFDGDGWVPNADAIFSWSPRFIDWSVSVPILMVQLIAVSAWTATASRRVRAMSIGAAFLMIFTGYLGGVVIDGGESLTALWVWGLISSVFFAALYGIVIVTVLRSRRAMSAEAWRYYRGAMLVFLVFWFAYPIAYALQGFTSGGQWTVVEHAIFCIADIVAKVGFGTLIHKVAVLRTKEHLRAEIP